MNESSTRMILIFLISSILINIYQYSEIKEYEYERSELIAMSIKNIDRLMDWYEFGLKMHASPYKVEICPSCFIKEIDTAMYLLNDKDKGTVSLRNIDYNIMNPIYLKPKVTFEGYNSSIIAVNKMDAMIYLENETTIRDLIFVTNNNTQTAIRASKEGIENVVIASSTVISNKNMSPFVIRNNLLSSVDYNETIVIPSSYNINNIDAINYLYCSQITLTKALRTPQCLRYIGISINMSE